MGKREEVYVFDDDENPSARPVSVEVTDDRVLAEEQDAIVDQLRFMRKRALALTDDDVVVSLEDKKVDQDLKNHRTIVKASFNQAIADVKAAATLAELDAIPWGTDVHELYVLEFPNTLGQTDPTKVKKQKEKKGSKGDEIPDTKSFQAAKLPRNLKSKR
jgi:hypothetical protein